MLLCMVQDPPKKTKSHTICTLTWASIRAAYTTRSKRSGLKGSIPSMSEVKPIWRGRFGYIFRSDWAIRSSKKNIRSKFTAHNRDIRREVHTHHSQHSSHSTTTMRANLAISEDEEEEEESLIPVALEKTFWYTDDDDDDNDGEIWSISAIKRSKKQKEREGRRRTKCQTFCTGFFFTSVFLGALNRSAAIVFVLGHCEAKAEERRRTQMRKSLISLGSIVRTGFSY